MVVVERLTKYAHFCSLAHPFKASTFATTFMDTVQKIHGTPQIIVSDRDPIFIGKLNYFFVWGLNWLIVPRIILKLMGKLKL